MPGLCRRLWKHRHNCWRGLRRMLMTWTDAVTLEILANDFASVSEEMGASRIRSSSLPIIREMLDCSCAVFDRHGRLLAQAEHIPAQLGLMEFALRHTLAEFP